MELLQYLFSDIWYFIGFILILLIVGEIITDIIKAFMNGKDK
jgi:quinol-cytochrome oxidoreductase complex cytochrome b subunit